MKTVHARGACLFFAWVCTSRSASLGVWHTNAQALKKGDEALVAKLKAEIQAVEARYAAEEKEVLALTAKEAQEAWERCDKVLYDRGDGGGTVLMAKVFKGRRRMQQNDP